MPRFPIESHDWRLEVERWVRQFKTDIDRLLRRQEPRFGEQYDKASGGGSGVLQEGRFRLGGSSSTGLYRTGSISAKNVDTGEIVTINGGEYARGYWFGGSSYTGDYVRAEQLESGDWYVLGSGTTFLKGTSAASAIAPGANASVTVHSKTFTLYALDQIRSGKDYACWWDDTDLKWYGSGVC